MSKTASKTISSNSVLQKFAQFYFKQFSLALVLGFNDKNSSISNNSV